MNSEIIEDVAFNIIRNAVIYLPLDVKHTLERAYAEETSRIGKTQLKSILENVRLAEQKQAPLCQDTGTITFYVKAGFKTENLEIVEKALIEATRRATHEIPLRPNAVDPFSVKLPPKNP